jgi:class 3 adenylate cyclase
MSFLVASDDDEQSSESPSIAVVESNVLGEEAEDVASLMREYAAVTPNRPSLLDRSLDRSVTTSLRLSRQGFRESGRITSFAVKSIRQGSQEWHATLRPFVADLAFFSLTQRRFSSRTDFRPYSCHAAVLFVDLSGYSKIAAILGNRGAHALSSVVNAYLARLLAIIRTHGGDVIKFAGDAVLVVWFGSESELEMNLLAAASCVMELQEKAGHHRVEGTNNLSFRIHCAMTCGLLESEVFAAPNHAHMQRLYHSVGGECLIEIAELVELAKPGEVCISDLVAEYLGDRGRYRSIDGRNGCKLLTGLELPPSAQDQMEMQVMEGVLTRESRRRRHNIEEEFIHPSVVKLLSHGGLSPTQISQMRNLCVLFIAMTSNGSSVNWLMEVQAVLDKRRCPSKFRY